MLFRCVWPFHRRVFCATVALINSREFADYLLQETAGKTNVRGSTILQLAQNCSGMCFTKSFDARSGRLTGEAQELRKMSRLEKITSVESKRTVNLQRPWREKVCVSNAVSYGQLLGKNAVALLSMIIPTGGTIEEEGCVPGPGAQSGLRFVSGRSLGMGGGSSCKVTCFHPAELHIGDMDKHMARIIFWSHNVCDSAVPGHCQIH